MADLTKLYAGVKSKDAKSLTLTQLHDWLEDNHYAQTLFDEEYDGACPCASGIALIDGYEVGFWCRCWRVSEQIEHGFQDLYVDTKHPDKHRIVVDLIHNLNKQNWYNPYRLIEGNDLVFDDPEVEDEPLKSAQDAAPITTNKEEDNGDN